jgi:hypothetical protein
MLKRLQAIMAQTQFCRLPSTIASEPPQNSSENPGFQSIALQVQQERLRQARQSFNLSLIIVVITAVFGFTGAGLLLTGKTTEGSVAATSSLLVSFCGLSLKLAKGASDKLK